MTGHRSALEVAREKRDAAAVDLAESLRVYGRADPHKFHVYMQRAAEFERTQRFELVAQTLVRRRLVEEVS